MVYPCPLEKRNFQIVLCRRNPDRAPQWGLRRGWRADVLAQQQLASWSHTSRVCDVPCYPGHASRTVLRTVVILVSRGVHPPGAWSLIPVSSVCTIGADLDVGNIKALSVDCVHAAAMLFAPVRRQERCLFPASRIPVSTFPETARHFAK